MQPAHFQLELDLLSDIFGTAHFGRHRAAQQRNAGTRPLAQPGTIELMVLGGRAEVPQDRLVILRQQSEAADLVLRPRADVRRRDVAHVVHVEAQQRADFGFCEQRFDARQAFPAQAIHIDALLPIHCHAFREFSVPLYASRFLVCESPRRARRAFHAACADRLPPMLPCDREAPPGPSILWPSPSVLKLPTNSRNIRRWAAVFNSSASAADHSFQVK